MPSLNQLKQFTVGEYHQLIDAGILSEDDKVELLDGLIVTMSPQGIPHAAAITQLTNYLPNQFQSRTQLRFQLPITLTTSEPEPDVAVVAQRENSYADHHPYPEDIYFLVEVADSSLTTDK